MKAKHQHMGNYKAVNLSYWVLLCNLSTLCDILVEATHTFVMNLCKMIFFARDYYQYKKHGILHMGALKTNAALSCSAEQHY